MALTKIPGSLIEASGNLTITDLTVTGDLSITGDLNSYNVTDLDVVDQTITLGAGQTEALSGGSGIIVDGSGASILWDETNTEWDFNNPIQVAGNIQTDGNFRAYDSVSTNYRNVLGYDSGNVKLQTGTGSSAYGISLFTAGSERLHIDGSGNVGIGTDNPLSLLHLSATSPTLIINSADENDSKIMFRESSNYAVSIFYEGSAGNGTDNNLHIRRELGGSETNLVTFSLGGDVKLNSTGALTLHKGTTAQRPSSPTTGMLRYNTTESKYEVYTDTWESIDTSNYEYSADFLVVAGGGGGGNGANGQIDAGGAGAGGLRTSYGSTSGGGASAETALTLRADVVYTITVGAGGAAQSNGADSSISGSNITTVTSNGGGAGGGSGQQSGQAGGSGGGSAEQGGTDGAGTSGQGYAGGGYAGGGAGEVGGTDGTGYGGDGIQVSITGSAIYYAGGGAGGGLIATGSLPGGDGGGGDGRNESDANDGFPGAANTGGGGGGANDDNNASGGTGGSGIVILRVPTVNYSDITTGSPTVTTDGAYTVMKFTSSGTYRG